MDDKIAANFCYIVGRPNCMCIYIVPDIYIVSYIDTDYDYVTIKHHWINGDTMFLISLQLNAWAIVNMMTIIAAKDDNDLGNMWPAWSRAESWCNFW
jgi:hypothetical protein